MRLIMVAASSLPAVLKAAGQAVSLKVALKNAEGWPSGLRRRS
ncbi:MAG: hypothetical protein ACRCTY_06925 [Candidatus Adiutrix sp.]